MSATIDAAAINCWIILDKPLGLTSAQGVAAVKRILREHGLPVPRIGHGGTLDPLATGVLPIACGEATKLAGAAGTKGVLDAAKAGSVTEAGDAVAGAATATGTLTSSDVDAAATKAWSIVGTPSATYGTFTVNATTGVWTYVLDNSLETTQALKEGEVVTQTYTVRVTDNFGAFVDQTVTVTVNGTNDVPVVTNAAAALSGTVTEAGHLDNGTAVAGTPSVSGALTATDVDQATGLTWSVVGTPSATYGAIAVNAASAIAIFIKKT